MTTAIMDGLAASLHAVGKWGFGIGTIWRGARGNHAGTRQSDRGTQGRARMPEGVSLLQVRIHPSWQSEESGGLGVPGVSGARLPQLPVFPSLRSYTCLPVPGPLLYRRGIREMRQGIAGHSSPGILHKPILCPWLWQGIKIPNLKSKAPMPETPGALHPVSDLWFRALESVWNPVLGISAGTVASRSPRVQYAAPRP